MPNDLTPEQAAVARDRAVAAGDMQTAGQMQERAGYEPLDLSKAFDIPADPAAAQAALDALEAQPGVVTSLLNPTDPLHKVNSAHRQALLDVATGKPPEDQPPDPDNPRPDDYQIDRPVGVTPDNYDHELEHSLRGWASDLAVPQAELSQVAFAWNTFAMNEVRDGVEELTDELVESRNIACQDMMEQRYGEELPARMADWDDMLNTLAPEKKAEINEFLDGTGAGSDPTIVGLLLDMAMAWKSRQTP